MKLFCASSQPKLPDFFQIELSTRRIISEGQVTCGRKPKRYMTNDTQDMLTQEEIVAGVERLAPWFQRIDLGRGIVTKTKSSSGESDDHPLGEWQVIKACLPADLTGRSVLDVGANAGFFAVETKRLG